MKFLVLFLIFSLFSVTNAAFDYFLLAQTWSPSYCKRQTVNCIFPVVENKFTIHGLFPANFSANNQEPFLLLSCPSKVKGTKMGEYVYISTTLEKDMEVHWPSYTMPNNNFWSHEWRRHGTCSEWSSGKYFNFALTNYKQVKIFEELKNRGIVPRDENQPVIFHHRSAFQKILGQKLQPNLNGKPEIQIRLMCDGDVLYEIMFCIQNDGFNYMYMDCPDNGTCHPVLPFRYLTHRLRLRVPSKHKIRIFAGFLIFVRLRHVDTLITPSPSDMHLALAIQMVQISDDESEAKEFVLTLDNTNFHDTISKHDFIVVEFCAPWCGHCKKLAPEYEKAASILRSHETPIVLAKVDANEEKNRDLASEYDVKGFPTIKILRNGGNYVQEYKGPREADGIVEYLKKQSGPASTEIKSADEASAFIGENKVVIIGVFPKFSREEFNNFTALAEKLRSDYDFGHTLDAKHLPKGESSVSGPIVRFFKPFDELFVDSKEFDVEALEKFIEESSIPVVTVFNNEPSNHPFVVKFFNTPNAKAMLFINFTAEGAESFKSKYRETAELYKQRGISFLIGDVESSQGAFQYFGLKEDQVPLIIIQHNDGKKFFKPNLEPDHVATWLKAYKDGNVAPYVKSEPIPETNNEPVKVVVRETLQDIVFNSGKNVLLEFYAPWRGHCKQLAPILDEVAVSFQNDADVVIAKLDATANDIPSDTFEVQGYPTLYFRSASGKISQYDGGRTKEDIIEFIEKNKDKPAAQQETEQPKAAAQQEVKQPKDEI